MRAVRRVDTVRGGAIGLLPRTLGEVRLSQSLTARMAPRLSPLSISIHVRAIQYAGVFSTTGRQLTRRMSPFSAIKPITMVKIANQCTHIEGSFDGI